MKAHITKKLIDGLKPQATARIIWDDELTRFGVRVTPAGIKSFVMDYTTQAGRRRRQTIGRFGVLTVEQAREKAIRILGQVVEGVDPLDVRQSARAGQTLRQFAAEYLAHVGSAKKPATVQANAYHLNKIILPKLGGLKLAAVTQEDIERLHRSLKDTPYTANRMLSTLSHLYAIGAAWGRVPPRFNPCQHIPRFKETPRKRFLSDDELAWVGRALTGLEAEYPHHVRAVRLLLFTGCRVSEILSARWTDVDLDRAVLHLRDSKTGPGDVALGEAAITLLAACDRDGAGWLIPSRGDGHLGRGALSAFWREKVSSAAGIEDAHLHDLRHTAGSVGSNLGLSMRHLQGVLRHTQVTTTERYAHLSRGPVHEAADRISAHIAAAMAAEPKTKGAVVPFRKKT